MKSWIKYITIIILVLLIGGLLAVNYAVPKLAVWAMPYKWKHIPVGEKKDIVHEYLGPPLQDSLWSTKGEEWNIKRVSKKYVLKITYNKDTVAQDYKLYYSCKLFGFNKTYFLSSDTLR